MPHSMVSVLKLILIKFSHYSKFIHTTLFDLPLIGGLNLIKLGVTMKFLTRIDVLLSASKESPLKSLSFPSNFLKLSLSESYQSNLLESHRSEIKYTILCLVGSSQEISVMYRRSSSVSEIEKSKISKFPPLNPERKA